MAAAAEQFRDIFLEELRIAELEIRDKLLFEFDGDVLRNEHHLAEAAFYRTRTERTTIGPVLRRVVRYFADSLPAEDGRRPPLVAERLAYERALAKAEREDGDPWVLWRAAREHEKKRAAPAGPARHVLRDAVRLAASETLRACPFCFGEVGADIVAVLAESQWSDIRQAQRDANRGRPRDPGAAEDSLDHPVETTTTEIIADAKCLLKYIDRKADVRRFTARARMLARDLVAGRLALPDACGTLVEAAAGPRASLPAGRGTSLNARSIETVRTKLKKQGLLPVDHKAAEAAEAADPGGPVVIYRILRTYIAQ